VALSGSEQNPDFASKSWLKVIRQRLLNKQATPAVEAFKQHGEDFHCCQIRLEDLVEGMNQKGGDLIDLEKLRAQIVARDSQIDNPFTKDAQLMAVHAARNYRGDRLDAYRQAAPVSRSRKRAIDRGQAAISLPARRWVVSRPI
jgi:predicted oxidoreductase